MKKILITGGAGFIGTNLVKHLASRDFEITVVDRADELWNRQNFCDLAKNLNVRMRAMNLDDETGLETLLDDFFPDWVLHLAAESHVDKSIADPAAFLKSNVEGTYVLLKAIHRAWQRNGSPKDFRFHYCSTDEVYGSLGPTGSFVETMPIHPNNPYSATKAAGEHLVTAWSNTCNLPILITRCSNNYGPWQGPDKFIPLTVGRCLRKEPILIHGSGENVRDWLHVEDHVRAIQAVLEHGTLGEVYNIGGGPNSECTNLEMAERICHVVSELQGTPVDDRLKHITLTRDRPGNDFRYSMNSTKLQNATGWKPTVSLETGIKSTVDWYIRHREYCAPTTISGVNHHDQ